MKIINSDGSKNPIHHRRSMRLQGYNYSSSGTYFVTICTWNREYLFGDIVDGKMLLNELGKITRQCWWAIPDHFPHAQLDVFVIMPNHVPTTTWHIQIHRVHYTRIKNRRYQMGQATHRPSHRLAT